MCVYRYIILDMLAALSHCIVFGVCRGGRPQRKVELYMKEGDENAEWRE